MGPKRAGLEGGERGGRVAGGCGTVQPTQGHKVKTHHDISHPLIFLPKVQLHPLVKIIAKQTVGLNSLSTTTEY